MASARYSPYDKRHATCGGRCQSSSVFFTCMLRGLCGSSELNSSTSSLRTPCSGRSCPKRSMRRSIRRSWSIRRLPGRLQAPAVPPAPAWGLPMGHPRILPAMTPAAGPVAIAFRGRFAVRYVVRCAVPAGFAAAAPAHSVGLAPDRPSAAWAVAWPTDRRHRSHPARPHVLRGVPAAVRRWRCLRRWASAELGCSTDRRLPAPWQPPCRGSRSAMWRPSAVPAPAAR